MFKPYIHQWILEKSKKILKYYKNIKKHNPLKDHVTPKTGVNGAEIFFIRNKK